VWGFKQYEDILAKKAHLITCSTCKEKP
jgi:hypothetical protein